MPTKITRISEPQDDNDERRAKALAAAEGELGSDCEPEAGDEGEGEGEESHDEWCNPKHGCHRARPFGTEGKD